MLSPAGRELFGRMTGGDLTIDFQAALDGDVGSDPLLGDDHADTA